MNLNALKWHARAQAERLGTLGAIGLALAVCAGGVQLALVSEAEAELATLRAEVQRLQMRSRSALGPASLRRGPERQLDTFYEFFPGMTTLPDWMLKVVAAADRQGVALELGEYKLIQEKGSRLVRYQITLPVKGSYEQIRGFIAAVLIEVPAAALEDIGLKRETIGERRLEARLKLTVFLRLEKG